MKKVSTVATKQSRKISEQKLTVGLDVGDRSSWYCVLDERGAAAGGALFPNFYPSPCTRVAHACACFWRRVGN